MDIKQTRLAFAVFLLGSLLLAAVAWSLMSPKLEPLRMLRYEDGVLVETVCGGCKL